MYASGGDREDGDASESLMTRRKTVDGIETGAV